MPFSYRENKRILPFFTSEKEKSNQLIERMEVRKQRQHERTNKKLERE